MLVQTFASPIEPPLRTYGVGVLAAVTATAVVLMIKDSPPVATFLLAVVLSAAVGGLRAALVTAVLSFVALSALAITDFPFSRDPSNLLRVFYFALIGAFMVWVVAKERRAAASLRERAHRMRTVIDTMPVMAWSLLPDARIEFLNKRWLDYTGLTEKEAIASPADTIHPDDRPRVLERWQEVSATCEIHEDEMRLRRADGAYRWFLVRTVPLRDGQGRIVRWYGTSTDIEDRKRAERRLVEVQEEERRHLARELHDEFGQILVSVDLHLHAARAEAGGVARANLDKSIGLLKRAAEHVRSLVLELRPAMLDAAGLDAALRWLAGEHERRTGVPVELAGRLGEVPAEVAKTCYRLVQEALTNIARHARARRVWIALGREGDALALEVRDDGTGFDTAVVPARAAGTGHVGLLGMRERVQILGGELLVDSAPGQGTRIRVSVPLAAAVS